MVPRGGWFKLQTDITEDPEVRKLDHEAFRLYICILSILRRREYVGGDLLVPLKTIIYHSCLEKEQILVRLREISRTPLGTAQYLKRTQEVRLNFPKWLQHQWDWIRKLRNFDGMNPDEVRKMAGISAHREDKIREEKKRGPRQRPAKVQMQSHAPAGIECNSGKNENISLLNKIANPLSLPAADEEDRQPSTEETEQ